MREQNLKLLAGRHTTVLSELLKKFHLKSQPGVFRTDDFQCSQISQRIPRGTVMEVSGAGRTSFVLRFLAENHCRSIAWLEEKMLTFPVSFPLHGVSLKNVLFSETGSSFSWVLSRLLQSQLFSVLVTRFRSQKVNSIFLRKIQLAAEKSHTNVILLRDHPTRQENWPLFIQIQMQNRKPFVFRLKHRKREVV